MLQAADIMVDLLPGGQADTTPGLHVELPEDRDWEEEDDDLDTPLELRCGAAQGHVFALMAWAGPPSTATSYKALGA